MALNTRAYDFVTKLKSPCACITGDEIVCKLAPNRYMYRGYYLTDKGVSELLADRTVTVQRLYVFETTKINASTLSELVEMNNFDGGKLITEDKIYTSCELENRKFMWCDDKNNQYSSASLIDKLMMWHPVIYLTNQIHSTTATVS